MSSQRSLSIDLIKFAAAFGVITIHLSPSTPDAEAFTRLFSHFAVPFFFLISIHFFINRVRLLAPLKFSVLRLDRILVPYVVWTAIYTLLRMFKHRVYGKALDIDPIGFLFFGTSAAQLYFLPLLLLFQAQALALILLFRGPRWRSFAGFLTVGIVMFSYLGLTRGYIDLDINLEKGAGYVLLAFLLSYTQSKEIGRRINIVIGRLIFPLIVSTVYLGYPLNMLGILTSPIVAYSVSAFALNWHWRTNSPAIRNLLTCSYGIYLAHFGFLEGFEFLAAELGWGFTPYSIPEKILLSSVICLCCVAFVSIARLHLISAYSFLGESISMAPRSVEASPSPQETGQPLSPVKSAC